MAPAAAGDAGKAQILGPKTLIFLRMRYGGRYIKKRGRREERGEKDWKVVRKEGEGREGREEGGEGGEMNLTS